MSQPLKVAFLFHQHQPNYEANGEFFMPWVRFHGTKDYWDMVRILEDYPKIHQTFNLVPSLILQIEELIAGKRDNVWRLTEKPVNQLTKEDKYEILRSFFLAADTRKILPHPRFKELFEKKRGHHFTADLFPSVVENFTDQDFLDVTALYNLAWIGEYSKFDNYFLPFVKKEKNYTQEDRLAILNGGINILKRILPIHKKMQDSGQIEVSVSPLNHPILPLLINSNLASVAMPYTDLPNPPFVYPQDADQQVKKALQVYEKRFGKKPNGMWPSEGSVSNEVADLLIKHGLKWMASDEEILFRSIENRNRLNIYRIWELFRPTGSINVIYRDHYLSDLIGFKYQFISPDEAANDMVAKLRTIRSEILRQPDGFNMLKDYVVPIILDGENCWEFFQSDGKDFLRTLYWILSKSDDFDCVTISEAINSTTHLPQSKIYPGSWINANYKVWIGHHEDNKAWTFVREAREILEQHIQKNELPKSDIERATNYMYIAESSDWFWWFGEEHSTPQADEFDYLCRENLKKVYESLKLIPPPYLDEPIRDSYGKGNLQLPSKQISPTMDGTQRRKTDWTGSGVYHPLYGQGAMHQVSTGFREILFGCDTKNFYFRLYPNGSLQTMNEVKLVIKVPSELSFIINESGMNIQAESLHLSGLNGKTHWVMVAKEVLDIQFSKNSIQMDGEIGFYISTTTKDGRVERYPNDGFIFWKLT